MSEVILVLRYSKLPRSKRCLCQTPPQCFLVYFASSFNGKGEELGCNYCRFCELSSVLEPGRPVKTDKPAILDDAIRVLSQLKTEAQELKETMRNYWRK